MVDTQNPLGLERSSELNHSFAADGNSGVIFWPGGTGTMFSEGDFGGGTLQLQYSIGGSTFTAVPGTSVQHTAAAAGAFQIGRCYLRLNLNGSTSPDLLTRINSSQNKAQ